MHFADVLDDHWKVIVDSILEEYHNHLYLSHNLTSITKMASGRTMPDASWGLLSASTSGLGCMPDDQGQLLSL